MGERVTKCMNAISWGIELVTGVMFTGTYANVAMLPRIIVSSDQLLFQFYFRIIFKGRALNF